MLCSDEKEERARRSGFYKNIGALAKKEILELKTRNARAHSRVSPVFVAPFGKLQTKSNFLSLERKKCPTIILKPMADPWIEIYHKLKPALEFIYQEQLKPID